MNTLMRSATATLRAVPIKRTYGDGGDACMYAHAMDVFEDHWTPIIVRELLLGPKRFTDLAQSARGITPAVLTTRLDQLEQRGLVVSVEIPMPTRARAYDLTPWGRGLEQIVLALGRWAHGSPNRPDGGDLTPDGAALALLAMAPERPMDPPIRLELLLTDRRVAGSPVAYRLDWDDRLRISRRADPDAPVRLRTDATTLASELFTGSIRGIHVDGVRRDADRLAAAFSPRRQRPTAPAG